jgi:hypothetical protein
MRSDERGAATQKLKLLRVYIDMDSFVIWRQETHFRNLLSMLDTHSITLSPDCTDKTFLYIHTEYTILLIYVIL